jgi:hypothetical protein
MPLKFTQQITYNNNFQEKETPEAGEITKKRVTGPLDYVTCPTVLNPTLTLNLGSDTTEMLVANSVPRRQAAW